MHYLRLQQSQHKQPFILLWRIWMHAHTFSKQTNITAATNTFGQNTPQSATLLAAKK
jgi:hypothetical protein